MNTNSPFPKILLLSVAILLCSTLSMDAIAQKESKQERKARQAQEQEEQYKFAKKAMFDTAFLIPAQTIQFVNTSLIPVSGTINYLQLNGNKSVLQIGSEISSEPGLNKLGGFTLKGDVRNIKISEKKNRIFVTYTLSGLIGTARIAVSITGSSKANIDVDGMFSGRAFTMRGTLVNLGESKTFEGTEF